MKPDIAGFLRGILSKLPFGKGKPKADDPFSDPESLIPKKKPEASLPRADFGAAVRAVAGNRAALAILGTFGLLCLSFAATCAFVSRGPEALPADRIPVHVALLDEFVIPEFLPGKGEFAWGRESAAKYGDREVAALWTVPAASRGAAALSAETDAAVRAILDGAP